ncbi:hypothetical protein [Solilutibacter oculi]|uniref:hypothetical protein n=1 Tax=Solilutibacter oculi TaxID=2698682 RepID=UPI0013A64F89|nr:hypothetical protein [Lysobacter oculi]
MGFDPEWISAAANVVTAGAVALAYKQFRGDHERSRRQLSVELMQEWVRNLTQHSTAARKLVDTFSDEQAKRLYAQEPFEVEKKNVPLLDAALSDTLNCAGDSYKLTVEQSSTLRWEVINYLNALEVILSAWNNNIADRDMLEEQFRDLVSPEKDVYLLKNFRKATGGAATYPCIEEFVKHLEAVKTPSTTGKGRVA